MQPVDFEAMAERVRNWGRWGDDDNRGTLNHIDPAALSRATAAATSGKLFGLGLQFSENGPMRGIFRRNPKLYVTALAEAIDPTNPRACFSDDDISMSLQCATHWDGLTHAHYDGLLYNGCKACDVLTTRGATRLGAEHLASPGILSRGVLADIARLKGVDVLPTDYAITPADLDEALARAGQAVAPGDILLVRTGQIRRFVVEDNAEALSGSQCGLAPECAGWLYDHRLAAVAADNVAVELISPESMSGYMPLPLHMMCLREMGMPLGEMWNLEALAADCAADGRYAFLLSAPPLGITGAFGSPVNPTVLK
ncbi:MAG TPA: cyclase family protein [Novosphingobium sp.]|nr:cyclase family protein [Novosphingobium sp.]